VDGDAAWKSTIAEYPALKDEIDLVLMRNDGIVQVQSRLGATATIRIANALRDYFGEWLEGPVRVVASVDTEPRFDF
jgi:hypothetical protein